MTQNKLRVSEEQPEETTDNPPVARKKSPVKLSRKLVRYFNSIGIFNRNQVVHSMPFILFIAVLIIGYISNSYYAEGIIRDIDKIKSEVKEERAEYISTFSEFMYQINQSQVAKSLKQLDIKESRQPQEKIFIPKQTTK